MAGQYCGAAKPRSFVNLGVAENTLMYDELVANMK
jgi:hypothetical protein